MPEPRPHKRLRRQITDTSAEEDEDASGDFNNNSHDLDTIYVGSNEQSKPSSAQQTSNSGAMSRPRRSGPNPSSTPSVTVSRSSSNSPEDNRKSIKLNFKMPASKLRQVTGVNPSSAPSQRRNVSGNSRNSFLGAEIITGPRSSRTQQKKYVDYNEDYDDEDEDDEDEEEEEPDDEDEEDAMGDEEDEMDDFERIGAEPEGGTDDEDTEMQDAPSAPVPTTVKLKAPRPPALPTSTARASARNTLKVPVKQIAQSAARPIASQTAPVKAVEVQEMEDEPNDEEVVSDIDEEDEEDEDEMGDEDDEEEDEEDEEEEDEDAEGEEDEEDADGEEDEEMNDTTLPTIAVPDGEGDEEEDDEDMSDDELAMRGDGSGASTPDYARLTKRQRGRGVEEDSFLALPMEPQIKKHFTAEEHRMRRAEMARRRKNLSEKRNEEEKMTTINKLLKKQTAKRRGKFLKAERPAAAEVAERAATSDIEDDQQIDIEVEKANPMYVRWISSRDGLQLGVPEEWLGKKAGAVFGPKVNGRGNGGGRLIEEL